MHAGPVQVPICDLRPIGYDPGLTSQQAEFIHGQAVARLSTETPTITVQTPTSWSRPRRSPNST